MSLFSKLRNVAIAAVAVMALSPVAQAQDTIKVGILHSLSGTMAISEVSLRDVVMMAIEEINAEGGVLGKQIEPVIVDTHRDECFVFV